MRKDEAKQERCYTWRHRWMDAAGELYAYSFGRLFESVRRRFTS